MPENSSIQGIEKVIVNAEQLFVVDSSGAQDLRRERFSNPEIIEKGALAIGDGKILWTGRTCELIPLIPADGDIEIINAAGCLVTPGLIDSHTHVVFGGTREDEFEQRIAGKSYLEIAQAGGGIKRTVRQTREASAEELFQNASIRLNEMLSLGITTVEIKSGYGLDRENEVKMLRVIQELDRRGPVDCVPTFLGAHEFPPDRSRETYIHELCEEMLPFVAHENLARYCDIFIEKGVYTLEEGKRILGVARDLGLKLKFHADQLSDGKVTELAVSMDAVSADHLNFLSDDAIEALASSTCIGVFLPGSDFFLGLPYYPPARKAIAGGAAVSLATDFNPGSCMTFNLHLIMTIACTQMKMTPAEVFSAVTLNAAAALESSHRIGSLQSGKAADIAIFGCPNYQMVCYHFGKNFVTAVLKDGQLVHGTTKTMTREELMKLHIQ